MELWVPITLAAALLQTVRSALQKRLRSRLSTNGATYCRFVFALPFAVLWQVLLTVGRDGQVLVPNARFATFVAIGGVAQIVATALLVHLFTLRNFAVGVAYSKTETVQTVAISVLLLGEGVTGGAAAGIAVSLLGVLLLSREPDATRGWLAATRMRPALIGLACGALFGLSAVSYRAAALALPDGDFLARATFTLTYAVTLQTVVMGLYLRITEPGQLSKVAKAWREALPVGLVGMLGSAGWFMAMTLENAAHVRAVGQVELAFAFAASVLVFRERPRLVESLGVALLMVGVVALVLA